MCHAKTNVAMSCLHKNTDYTNALSPEICVSVKEVGRHIQLSPYICSLRRSFVYLPLFPPSLSLSFSLSLLYGSHLLKRCCICLSNSTYPNTVCKKNSIDTSLMICIFHSIFGLESKVFPVIFNTLSALMSMN